jgi:hypothetical protein
MALTKAHNRMIEGASVNVKDFGAVGDGVTDDTAAIQAAIDAAAGRKWVEFNGAKTYAVSAEIDCHTGSQGVKIRGNMATIKATAAMNAIMSVDSTTVINCQIHDMIMSGASLATYCFKGTLITEQNSIISNVTVTGAVSHGMYLDGCQVNYLENIRLMNNGGDGALFESCNGMTVNSLRARTNGGNGLTISRGVRSYTGGCQISNVNIEISSLSGISVVDTKSPVTITGGWFENNIGDGINIGALATGVIVNGNGIIGTEGTGGYVAVRLQDGCAACEVTGNKFQYSTGGSAVYNVVKDESTSTAVSNVVHPNYTRSNGAIINPVGKDTYNEQDRTRQMTTVNAVGAGGWLAGGEAIIVPAAGSSTFVWTPSGTFGIPGADYRGAYAIEIDCVGYFVGVDQSIYKQFKIFTSTMDANAYDASISETHSLGDSRKADLTGATPTAPGSSAISVVFSNANATSFKGTFTWRVVMTTTGQLTLAVT